MLNSFMMYVFLPSSHFQELFIVTFMIISFDLMCVIFACCVVFIVCAVYFCACSVVLYQRRSMLCCTFVLCILQYRRTAMLNSGDKIINQSINQS